MCAIKVSTRKQDKCISSLFQHVLILERKITTPAADYVQRTCHQDIFKPTTPSSKHSLVKLTIAYIINYILVDFFLDRIRQEFYQHAEVHFAHCVGVFDGCTREVFLIRLWLPPAMNRRIQGLVVKVVKVVGDVGF